MNESGVNANILASSGLEDRHRQLQSRGDTQTLPRITIVTPSYNQGRFLEHTICSVTKQGYPNLEYIVMDGGSNDGSREIIKSYESELTYWQSKKDNGQSDAIWQGFSRSTGEILGWVNSDDLLMPGCLLAVGQYFNEHPEIDCVVGNTIVIDEQNEIVRNRLRLPRLVIGETETFEKLLVRPGHSFYQPASFWRRQAYIDAGGIDINFQFAMDYDLYLRLASLKPFGHIDRFLAAFRVHMQSKSSKLQATRQRECEQLWKRYDIQHNMPRHVLARGSLLFSTILRNFPYRFGALIGAIDLPEIATCKQA